MGFAKVLYKNQPAEILEQSDNGRIIFRYDDNWIQDNTKPPISLTLPKEEKEFFTENLFPFFYYFLPEGVNKRMICRTYKIDESDAFGILVTAAKIDTVEAITIERI